MKKLLVLILVISVMLVYSAASFAATVTFSGELNLGYNFENGLQGPVTLGGYPTDNKLFVNIQANDQLSGTVMFRDKNYGTTAASTTSGDPTAAYPYIDRAFVTYKTDAATYTAGRFPLNTKDSVDMLSGILYNGDYKDGFGVQALIPLVGSLTAKVYVAAPKSDSFTWNSSSLTPVVSGNDSTMIDYAVALAYTGSNFGYSINTLGIGQKNYFKWASGWGPSPTSSGYTTLGTILALNAYFMPASSTKLYIHYGQSQDNGTSANLTSTVIGCSYDDKNVPVYARLEYDFQKGVSNTGAYNPLGIRLGYKLGGGLYMEYDRVQYGDDKYDAGANCFNQNFVKIKLVF